MLSLRIISILFAVMLFCFISFFVAAEENGSLDDLFDDPAEDILATETDIDHRKQFEETEQIVIRRSFTSTAASSVGWIGFPQFNDLYEGFETTAGAVAEARLSFTAKPSPLFGMGGSFYTEVDYKNGIPDWTNIIIDELYGDYILLDKAFFRMGKFPMKWGNGRLFTPGDLMVLSEKGLAFRANLPTVMDGVTFVSLANTYYDTKPGSSFSMTDDLVNAILLEKIFGNVLFSLGAKSHFKQNESTKALASIKTVVLKTDIFTDFILCYDIDNNPNFQTLAGFFREWEKLKIYGEYYFDGLVERNKGHNIGLATGYKNIFSGPIDTGIEWRHAFVDNSGRVFPAISFSPWSLIKINFGIPILYGNDATRIILEDRDEDDKEDPNYYMPSKRGLSFLFSVRLSYSF